MQPVGSGFLPISSLLGEEGEQGAPGTLECLACMGLLTSL